MPEIYITGFFLCIGLLSLTALVSEFQTGIVIYKRGNIDVRENPRLFYLRIFIQIAFIAFATAMVLHAFGLIGDPLIWMHRYLPFLLPR